MQCRVYPVRLCTLLSPFETQPDLQKNARIIYLLHNGWEGGYRSHTGLLPSEFEQERGHRHRRVRIKQPQLWLQDQPDERKGEGSSWKRGNEEPYTKGISGKGRKHTLWHRWRSRLVVYPCLTAVGKPSKMKHDGPLSRLSPSLASCWATIDAATIAFNLWIILHF
jgi:hypothetical protein